MTRSTDELAADLRERRTRDARERFDGNVVVGKDILELLSSAMYVSPLAMFREYVQNAADSIDAAIGRGLLKGSVPGRIEIALDRVNREVRIRDNGAGVEQRLVKRTLTSIGASAKRGATFRGFRGVGRFAGIGLAQALVFRTKASGDELVTEVRWDCRRLRELLRDSSYRGDLSEVLREVVTVSTEPHPRATEHFFEVVLERVVRVKNDILLNESEIAKYLAQVAPAPFAEGFTFRDEIEKILGEHVPACRFRISVEGASPALTRPYVDEFEVRKGRTDKFVSLERLEVRDEEGRLRAIGWLLHHSYLGAIPASPLVRGLRARVGDMQIGDEDIFSVIFPESRFASWVVGELHILDREILPNGRRDHFEQNAALSQLLLQLAPLGRDLARRCRQSSAERNRARKVESMLDSASDAIGVLRTGVVAPSAVSGRQREIRRLLSAVEDLLVRGAISDDALARRVERRLRDLSRSADSLVIGEARRNVLAQCPPARRRVVEEMLDLVVACAPNSRIGASLVQGILERLATK